MGVKRLVKWSNRSCEAEAEPSRAVHNHMQLAGV